MFVPGPARIGGDSRIGRRDPRLAIDDNVRPDGGAQRQQAFPIDLPGQIDAKAVNAEFLDPMLGLVDQPAPRHRPIFGFHFIAERADMVAILIGAVVIFAVKRVEIEHIIAPVHVLAGMVGNKIDDHGHAALMAGLHQSAEIGALLAKRAAFAAIAVFNRKSVRRPIAPLVVFRGNAHGLHVGIVGEGGAPVRVRVMQEFLHRHQMQHIDPEVGDRIEPNFLPARIAQAALRHAGQGSLKVGRDGQQIGKVLDVHLIGDDIGHGRPPFGQRHCRPPLPPNPALALRLVLHARIWVRDLGRVGLEKAASRSLRPKYAKIVIDPVQIAGDLRLPNPV